MRFVFVKKLFLSLAAAFFLLLFFELGARVILKLYPVYPNCDAVWRLMWKKDYQRSGESYPRFEEYDPTRGWRAKANQRKSLGLVSTNSKGIRGLDEYAYEKPAGKSRILILGDSMTFGDEVGDDIPYPNQLGKMLSKSQVINFGVCGYGHDQMLIYLREEGVKYNPDILVLGFIPGDMERNLLTFRSYAKPRFRFIKGKLVIENYPVLPPGKIYSRQKYRLRLLDLLEILYAGFKSKTGIKVREEKVITEAIFDEIIRTAESIQATPLFIYLACGKELVNVSTELNPEEKFLSDYCKRKGVLFMSTRPYFASFAKDGGRLKTEGHWGEVEHSIAAQAIRDYLTCGTPEVRI